MSEEQSLIKAQEAMIAEINPFEATSVELLEKATAQEVTNEQQLASAMAVKKQITTHRKLVTDTRLGITRRFDNIKKAIMNREDEILLPLDQGQNLLGEKILNYQEEQDRIRREEEKRINDMVKRFDVSVYNFKDVDTVQDEGERLKKVYSELKSEDQKIPAVKAAVVNSTNALADRKAYLIEQEEQRIAREKLEADRKKQSEERAKLDADKAATDEKARKIKAEEERLEREKERRDAELKAEADRKEQERLEKQRVKTGARTVVSFEIVDESAVDRELCEPSSKLINEYIRTCKDKIVSGEITSINGINFTVTRKV